MPPTQKPSLNEILARDDGRVRRSADIVGVKDTEKRIVEVAFSSEAEVSRWFGAEILDHSPGAIQDERLRNGAAVLWNHDWDEQVGVVEQYLGVGSDRKARALLRFSRGQRATELFQDVEDGIIRHISVGYSLREVKLKETREDGTDVYLVTKWEPFEISMVSIPADTGVGVGRSLNGNDTPPEDAPESPADTPTRTQETPSEDPPMPPAAAPAVDPAAPTTAELLSARGQATADERARVSAILEMGEKYNARDLAAQFVRGDKGVDEFRGVLLEHVNKRGQSPLPATDPNIGLSDKEAGRFSFMRAINALANPTDRAAQEAAAFEFDASRAAIAKLNKRDVKGIMVPYEVLTRALNSSTSGSAAGDTGGNAIATNLMAGSFIDILRNRTLVMKLGRTMPGLVGNVDIPKQTDKASGYWIGEDDDATEDGLELGQLELSPKTVAAYTELTRKLMQQDSVGVEALVRFDLAAALGTTIDLAGFYGTGSSNQPRGILNTSGINVVDFAASSSLPTYAEIVQMETECAADNADVESMRYIVNAGMRGHLKTTQKFSGTNGAPVWEEGNTLNGYGAEVSNQIGAGDVVYGNFADLIVAMWGGLELNADPYSGSKKGRLRIVAFQDVDFGLRRVESFCKGKYIP